MERMSGTFREPEKPRTVEVEIEGRTETSFPEIDPGQMKPVPLRDIVWGDTALRFQGVGTHSIPVGIFGMEIPVALYAGQIEFSQKTKKSRVDLTKVTQGKPVMFTGTSNGFYAYDSELAGRYDQFYVVGLQPDELEASMTRLSALYHELGHALIFDQSFDAALIQAGISLHSKDLPPVLKAKEYARVIANEVPDGLRSSFPRVNRRNIREIESKVRRIEGGVSLFHERNAWAAGMDLSRNLGLPTGFDHSSSYFDYARLCLSTYARSTGDQRFVDGWK